MSDNIVINISQRELNEIIQKVIFELKEQNKIPFETVFGEMMNQNIIFEGLITSYPIKSVINILNNKDIRKYGVSCFPLFTTLKQNRGKEDSDFTQYQLVVNFTKGFNTINWETLSNYVHLISTCGWYLAQVRGNFGIESELTNELFIQYDTTPVMLIFEPKYDLEVEKESIPDYCYHITPTRVVNKIKNSRGLTPRDYGKVGNHPERVYLFTTKPSNWKEIAEDFKFNMHIDEPYTLLKVSMKNLKSSKFYYDQNSNYNPAIYTLEPIPHFAINIEDNE